MTLLMRDPRKRLGGPGLRASPCEGESRLLSLAVAIDYESDNLYPCTYWCTTCNRGTSSPKELLMHMNQSMRLLIFQFVAE